MERDKNVRKSMEEVCSKIDLRALLKKYRFSYLNTKYLHNLYGIHYLKTVHFGHKKEGDPVSRYDQRATRFEKKI